MIGYKGWCVGCDGTILHTSNGGETWEEQNSSIDSDLFKVKFLNSLEGWILGHYIVLYTTDGGKNWEIRNDLNGWFVDIDFFDDQNGLLVERFGAVLKTKDAGMNWQLVNNEPLSVRLTSVAILNENEAWIGGWQGLAHTADKGATIQWYDVPNISLVRYLQFVENNSGFLSNDYGDFLVTKDGGWTWHELPRGQGLNAMVSTFWALNANKVWIYLGLASGHLKQITADQTLTITEIPEYWVHTINSIFFINPNIGWAIGEGGTILKYTDDSSSSIKVQGKQIYIFPNPFDETGTNISFLLQQSQQVTIQIYNSLGQKLITLYEGLLNNGVIKIFWKPNNLASGVYFISIRSNEFNHAQKCAYVHH